MNMNVQIVINTLQKKISELTLTNVMLEAQISDLQTQLNTITEQNSNAVSYTHLTLPTIYSV